MLWLDASQPDLARSATAEPKGKLAATESVHDVTVLHPAFARGLGDGRSSGAVDTQWLGRGRWIAPETRADTSAYFLARLTE